MKLVRKGEAPKSDDLEAVAQVPHMPWDAAMSMLSTGDYDVVGYPRGERGPDQPTIQSPSPGTDPLGGKELVVKGQLSNIVPALDRGVAGGGLPASPMPEKNDAPPPPKLAQPLAPAPAPTPEPKAPVKPADK